jgi:hypothetical protein
MRHIGLSSATKLAKVLAAGSVLLFLAFMGGMEYWKREVLPAKPQFKDAFAFISASATIKNEFGDLISATLSAPFSYHWDFDKDEATSGYFIFSVKGVKAAGAGSVYWRYQPKTNTFIVTRLVERDSQFRNHDLEIR